MIASTTEARLRECLSGIRFPANRNDLLAAAIANGCDEETTDALRDISSLTYANLKQVLASITVIDDPNDARAPSPPDREDADDTRD